MTKHILFCSILSISALVSTNVFADGFSLCEKWCTTAGYAGCAKAAADKDSQLLNSANLTKTEGNKLSVQLSLQDIGCTG